MYLEELVLEGFKSYPVRTPITGWDSSFNCITGLNGSGKSNILDAICFVLGLTNMSHVRATNQQDLIYKRGQAGITRASVTAVFNNSDKSKSPIGMEGLAQITVTRQIALPNISKYILNGHKSTQQAVQTIFQSVQLNINNPNFLIMQGRITKVLNMRPQEILGLIEEAAGTRMYEERKDKAKKTMAKKEKRVQEITTLLEEEITPKLDTLREEKRSFLEYQKRSTELEKLARLLRAWEWKESTERVKRKEAEIERRKQDVETLKAARNERQREQKLAEAEKSDAIKRREKELSKGGHYQRLQETVADLEKKVVQFETGNEFKQAAVEDQRGQITTLEQSIADLQASKEQQTKQVQTLNSRHDELKARHAEATRKYESSQELLQSLTTGLAADNANTSGGGYLGQLDDAKRRIAAAVTEEEQAKGRINRVRQELAGVEEQWRKFEREANDGSRQVEKAKKELDELQKRFDKSNWSEEKENQASVSIQQAREQVRRLTENRDQVRARLGSLDFTYADPVPNFDRSKVKGLVANLISINERDYDKTTALEVAAGGRLYNVVVENEQVGSQLLDHGKLKKRVTLIPLNKINAFKASAQTLATATKVGNGKVKLALSLVGYDDEVTNAMNYVFGNVLICEDGATAKAVTYDSRINMKSVTYDGDVYDPSGTISGGSAPTGSGILVKAQELNKAEKALAAAKEALRRLEAEEAQYRGKREEWNKLKRDLEMKRHEVKLLEEQISGSNAARLGSKVTELRSVIEELTTAATVAKQKQKDGEAEVKKLQKDMKEFESNKDGKLKQLKTEIAANKSELAKATTALKEQQRLWQTAQLELDQIVTDIETSQKDFDNMQKALATLVKEAKKIAEQLEQAKEEYSEADAQLQSERAKISRFDDEVKELDAAITRIKGAITENEIEAQKAEHELTSATKDRTASMNTVAALEKQHPWIPEEKKQFGKPGGMYDFNAVNIQDLREKAKELEDKQKGMKKRINPKAIAMNEVVEKREADLKRNLQQVLKDKTKIEETIEELDRYKIDALEKTWTKVSKDFGDIFGDLLPGNNAKLVYAESGNLTAGLEVKVQLGSVWKQSLTELSGGQRSLIALSLIMSLLQFKPAPMYILDEIDAALDLSHTQHIGELFKHRFKGSQFIVVSLKDGLFNNANVLFRTKFRDGTSIVEKTTQRTTSAVYRNGR